MPELPEVEVVRLGLESHVVGKTVRSVEVLHPRAVRRHDLGGLDLIGQLRGQRIASAQRRGKYLWLVMEPGAFATVVHLGMSGQMLVQPPTAPDEKHLRIRARLDDGSDLRFVDQRTFGGWALAPIVTVNGTQVPEPVAHIARDPIDPLFDAESVVNVLRGKHTEIKRALLDQTVLSGVGNIYADEALWRAKIHGNRIAETLTRPALRRLLTGVHAVMGEALAQGGTSFDALYVNVNGQSGYFDRSLDAYGQDGLPCSRCGAPIRREKFMNRSSFSCPTCQPRPRHLRT
ncbi:bifunctional DNA-formamidopyrimidine glycosylase/DNA-(apurinic or apyrimidinic site) lyase [Rhodococcus fascians]|uniref:bifunctional DNA-formamidopyrimidine glycosylase/DNA-(apurinic or apyrimidinic site) lyase n=1 Tax=Rhodococcoides fascians TaxID=1828 RepID=UPI00050BEE0A|nr:bifunctional DNA-formamidopyrimidine glycosylase/DNA-(apurinic or apyrimidinic site) lyase [Rhodococcus fascians]MBY4380376.1 bifunctional DNA-formamidopyrimidine glycosylase/DNA-(apurinic or apyrimidinic site) lyase [Rhodococcus fascians]MBY4395157.1 bifunctional DNA-formamidopyrimidine glycosylase/DNA-(apurinic or apyrimidinic site) lyase [Rhodococcus fascians]MBY4405102.1 bifunctional DNA-formamidopyrimidine glycosylase/DNA-(apurinic or apyrimidinic site) lyase [Rhodococcus fascians]MBY44